MAAAQKNNVDISLSQKEFPSHVNMTMVERNHAEMQVEMLFSQIMMIIVTTVYT